MTVAVETVGEISSSPNAVRAAQIGHAVADTDDAAKKEIGAPYLEATEPFLALSAAGKDVAALEILNSQNQEYQDAGSTLESYVDFNRKLAAADVDAAVSMLRATEGIAEGDVDQQVTLESRDELGRTAGAFRRMIDYLKEMAGAADRVAAGDLTVQVEPKSERDALGTALKGMTGNLRELIGSVTESSGSLSAASQQMASTSDEAGRAVGEIASAVGEVASVAEQSSASAEQVSASTQQTSASTQEIAASAQELARTAERLQALVGRFQLA